MVKDEHFTDNLAGITSAFHGRINTNEATARQFINPFMVKAVTNVISHYSMTRLAVGEDFDGNRGYGRLDYVVYCQDLAVLITEAKMTDMQGGVTQNIVQLCTATEVSNPIDFILILILFTHGYFRKSVNASQPLVLQSPSVLYRQGDVGSFSAGLVVQTTLL